MPLRQPTIPIPEIVGTSDAICRLIDLVDTVARSDCAVLIEGESGTGKELVARRLHARGPRAVRPLIPVNCAGISEALFESQFFGHVRGAFTGAERSLQGLVRSADGGTLLLDEVGEIPLGQQAKLLRVLQDGEVLPVGETRPVSVDTRFLAATNRSLGELVDEGRFREDLYYRLDVVRIDVPPLRDRREDIDPLLDHFLPEVALRTGYESRTVRREVRDRLAAYPWPGNVRELKAWVERLYATGLPAEVLAASLGQRRPQAAATDVPDGALTLEDAERIAIRRAMQLAEDNQTEAARLLGIHRSTLARKLDSLRVA